MVFSSLIGKGKLFGEFFREKKKSLANGTKAIVCVMRKTLKMLLGVFRSAEAFNPQRVFSALPAAA